MADGAHRAIRLLGCVRYRGIRLHRADLMDIIPLFAT